MGFGLINIKIGKLRNVRVFLFLDSFLNSLRIEKFRSIKMRFIGKLFTLLLYYGLNAYMLLPTVKI